MSNILTLLSNGIISYLLVASVIAVAVTLLVLVTIKLLKIQTPVYCHLLWLSALIIIIALPVTWLHIPKLTLEVLPSQSPVAEPAETLEAATSAVTDITAIPKIAENIIVENHAATSTNTEQSILVETNIAQPISFKTWVVIAWFFGVVFMLARLIAGWVSIRRICLSAVPISESELAGGMFGQKLKVLITSKVNSPVCFGLFKPVVILSEEMYRSSSPEDLQMVLNHEFAHIQRRDGLANLFQRLIEAIFFFHPLIWYISSQVSHQREHICDNYVLDRGASPRNYVGLLSRIAEQGLERNHLHTVAMFEGRLLSRVRSMLDPEHNCQTKVSGWGLISVVLVVSMCMAFGCIRIETKTQAIAEVPQKTISVYVTNSKGDPIANASVEALADYKPVGSAKTGNDGKAALKVPQDAKIAWIIALKGGDGFDYYEAHGGIPARDVHKIPEKVDLVLDGARIISIRGVDSNGAPVSGVSFVPWTIIKIGKGFRVNLSGSKIAAVSTNDDGIAKFDWFPAGDDEYLSGRVRLGTGFVVQGGQYCWPDSELKKHYQAYPPITTAHLLRKTPISGKALLADGSVVGGVLVRVEGRGNTPFFCRRETRTSADGSYSIDVYPNQSYMVTVIDDKWATETHQNVIVMENKPIKNLDLILTEGTLIHGQVVSEKDKQPYKGELVYLSQNGSALPTEFRDKGQFGNFSNNASLIRTAITDEQGNYSFRVGPGNYAIGTTPLVLHQAKYKKFKIAAEKAINHDIQSPKPVKTLAKNIGFMFADSENVYNGMMVISNSCENCHDAHSPKPISLKEKQKKEQEAKERELRIKKNVKDLNENPEATLSRLTYEELYDAWEFERNSIKRGPAVKDGKKKNARMIELCKAYTYRFTQQAIKEPNRWDSCLLWVARGGVEGPDFEAMMEFMGRRAYDTKRVDPLYSILPGLAHFKSDTLDRVLSDLSIKHPSENLRGVALYTIAVRMKRQADSNKSKEGYNEAKKLLEKVIAEDPFVRIGRDRLKSVAQELLDEIESSMAGGE